MGRAFSGSELSRWNLTAEKTSPSQMAASAEARHSSNEGRPHLNENIQAQSLRSSETLAAMHEAAPGRDASDTHLFVEPVDVGRTSGIKSTEFGQQNVVVGDHLQQVDRQVPKYANNSIKTAIFLQMNAPNTELC